MYAHQVIEDLKTFLIKRKSAGKSIKECLLLINLIKNAQHFHLPDFDKIDTSKMPQQFKLSNELIEYTPPFSICWFDFPSITGGGLEPGQTKSSKRGVLTVMEGDAITMLGFCFFDLIKCWVPPMLGFRLNIKTKTADIGAFFKEAEYFPKNQIELIDQETAGDRCHVLQSLSILNCKNVGTIDNHAPEKLNKKRIKDGKQPLFIYKTLIIKPTGKRQEAQAAQGLWDNRVHLCRGHFKTYTEQNPLFGRVTGRFWWQPSIRGNKEKGLVMKDYKIVSV